MIRWHSAAGLTLSLGLLITLDLLGDWIHAHLRVPLPGSLIGMLALAAIVRVADSRRPGSVIALGRMSAFLARNLAFFFVPVAVGIVSSARLFAGHWALIVSTLLVTTTLTFLTTTWMMQILSPRHRSLALDGEESSG